MKKIVAMISGSLLALLLVFGMTPMQAKAAEKTYTVTFRCGNVGEFQPDAVNIDGAKATSSYIKVDVKRGETLASIFESDSAMNTFFSNQNVLKTESVEGGTYRALPIEGFSVTDEITHNQDVVMSYCRVVNPARYVISYVNGANGAFVAAPVYGLGDADEVITAEPLTIAGFHTTGTKQEVTLKEGKTALITFVYSQDESVVYSTEVIYTDGDVVYNDLVTYIGQTYTVAGGGAGADAGAGAGDAGDQLVAIEDTETPLANTTLDDNNLVEIEDTETPLANTTLGNSIRAALIAAVVLMATIGSIIIVKKARKKA